MRETGSLVVETRDNVNDGDKTKDAAALESTISPAVVPRATGPVGLPRQESSREARSGQVPRPPSANGRLANGTRTRAAYRAGIGIDAKLFVLLLGAFATLAVIAAFVSARQITVALTNEYTARGTAIATGLAAASAAPLSNRDTAQLRQLVSQFGSLEGVSYVILSQGSRIVGHSLRGELPQELAVANDGAGIRERLYTDPETQQRLTAIDVEEPVPGGLGSVRVGMDRAQIVQQGGESTTVLVLALGLAALLAAFGGLWLTRRTVRPIRHLVVIARKVGRGDLSELALVQSSDEIGLLARTFNESISRLRTLVKTESERDEERRQRQALQENISRFLDVATGVASGDLTLRGEVTTDVLGSVVDAINVMIEEIGDAIAHARGAAGTVHDSAKDLIGTTEKMVAGVQTQARNAAGVRSRVDEMADSVRLVAESAESSASAAHQTRQAADKGHQAVGETLRQMQQIRREVLALSNRIKSLGDRSMEFSEIIDTLSSLASQTNLLALNAAIEASGAGEYGARFGVVADQVRALAEDSARAAKNVTTLIKRVQAEVQEAVAAMEASTRRVESGFKVNTEAGEQLKEIAEISTQSAELAARISSSTREQVEVAERVRDAISSIAEISDETESEVVAGRQAAERLLGLSDELNQHLERFKLVS